MLKTNKLLPVLGSFLLAIAYAEVPEDILQSAQSTRLTYVERVKNESLNALYQNALKNTPWIHEDVWACYGNSFSTRAYTYTANDETKLEAIALKAAYGSRGINLESYVAQLSPDGVRILAENRRKKSYTNRQLTAHTRDTDSTSDECKEARKSIKKMVSDLDASLKIGISEDTDQDFDMEIYNTMIIDPTNKQVVVVSVGSEDIPEPPNE